MGQTMYLSDDCKCQIKWTFVDESYLLNKCELWIDGNDMCLRLSGNRQKPICGRLRNYRRKTALQALRKHGIASGDAYFGRHFEDAIFQAWHDLGLPDGYTEPILKEIC